MDLQTQVKQIIRRGYPADRKQQSNDFGILQTYYKRNTGRHFSGCSCRKRELYRIVENILIKKGEL